MRQCKIVGYRNSVNFDPNADEIVDEIYGNQRNPNEPFGNIYPILLSFVSTCMCKVTLRRNGFLLKFVTSHDVTAVR